MEYYNQQVAENKDTFASIWKTISRALPRQTSHDVQYTKDTDVLAEEFKEYFVSVGEQTTCASANHTSTRGLNISEVTCTIRQKTEDEYFCFQFVTTAQIRKVIMVMPSNKATGFDLF